ncbi:hypothetical protein [Roseovarius ramblicola]|uniref:Phytanoyl-CoA dioxygenase (PhyH) n=1 Tax=Roseovarius ramblicola TaxID=2022336 RepID=A0ABV5I0P0_9RHOB
MVAGFAGKGWAIFPPEPGVQAWARAARNAARVRMAEPERRQAGLACEGTWFVGLDCLPNDAAGCVAGVPLIGAARRAADALAGPLPLHAGQVSVVWPGYPRPRAGEGPAAFRYRQKRDAAHVDGLLPIGPERRRMLRERHAWLLGLPLTEVGAGASPLVVWEGSHHLMRRAFAAALDGIDPRDWADVDLTGTYQAARREAFETCRRVALVAPPGGAMLMHRMILHGIAPWREGATAPPEGRMVAYFRPDFPDEARDDWLTAP